MLLIKVRMTDLPMFHALHGVLRARTWRRNMQSGWIFSSLDLFIDMEVGKATNCAK